MPISRKAPWYLLLAIFAIASCSSAPSSDPMNTPEPPDSPQALADPTAVTWDDVTLHNFDRCLSHGNLWLGGSQGPGRADVSDSSADPKTADEPSHQVQAEYPFHLHLDYQNVQSLAFGPDNLEYLHVPFTCYSDDPALSSSGNQEQFDAGLLIVDRDNNGDLLQIGTITAADPASDFAAQADATMDNAEDPDRYLTTDVNGLGLDYYAFTTPSGLHHCVITPFSNTDANSSVICMMSFHEGVAPDAFDSLQVPYLDSNGGNLMPLSDSAYLAMDSKTVLNYGATLTAHGITCGVEETGITCHAGDHTFSASASSYQFY